ncbi:FadR family transcriptional regulator [Peribacillus cavernae]|uniref:FadR family transcriptional regulator n=1 Tax=Peribacillus cavernae TaxID=1674310 RepID=A0A3S0TR78_9BACI|nr:FadR/GntR family transcriptional regulator [Peribacillus cavernae]MDQ0219778.1 GntR family transcriptional repressor for pyruvate dehydrogenase complex [Peribacillus cavernae]RUQ25193.1 FadR family transcriptional regulator [Peribacillus cavernae]
MIEPVKRINVTDSIVNQIKELVLQGELNQGDKLPPERELMTLFEVGRPSLREALKVLEAQGLIEKSQKGTVITGNHDKFFTDSLMFLLYFSSTDWQDIFESRRFIERELTYLTTTRATIEDFIEMEKTIVNMELAINKDNQEDYVSANLHFHEKIAKSSKNLVMYHLYQSINKLIEHAQVQAVTVPGIMDDSLQYHKDILTAMKQRNAELASDLMVNHITSVHGFLQKKQNY